MDILTRIAIGVISVVLLADKLLPYILKNRSQNVNGKMAGAQSIEFWQTAQREAIRLVLTPELVPMREVLKEITIAMRDVNQTNQDLRVAMMELVTLARKDR